MPWLLLKEILWQQGFASGRKWVDLDSTILPVGNGQIVQSRARSLHLCGCLGALVPWCHDGLLPCSAAVVPCSGGQWPLATSAVHKSVTGSQSASRHLLPTSNNPNSEHTAVHHLTRTNCQNQTQATPNTTAAVELGHTALLRIFCNCLIQDCSAVF